MKTPGLHHVPGLTNCILKFGFHGEIFAKTPGLYQVSELGNYILKFGRQTDQQTDGWTDRPGGFQGEVLTKTPGLYEVPKLRNMSLEKF